MDLPRVRAVAERGIGRQAYASVDLAVSVRGAEPAGFQLGPLGAQLWTCATKTLLAVAAASLVSQGMVAYDDELGRYVPELCGTGWHRIPLRAILSHSVRLTADIAVLSAFRTDAEVLRCCAANPPVPAAGPGPGPAYTQWTSGFLLGQVIAAVASEPHETFLRREIAGRLGLSSTSLRYPLSHHAELTRSVLPLLADVEAQGITGHMPLGLVGKLRVRDDRAWPGISGSGPMSDLVRVLAALLPVGGRGAGLVSPAVAREVTTVHRRGVHGTAGDNSLAWGLGVAVDQRMASPRCSPGTFGHFGQGGTVLVFGDPALYLVAGLRLGGTGTGMAATLRRAALVEALLADVQDGLG